MLRVPWMMKLLKSRNLEVTQMSKVVWRKEGFDRLVYYSILFFGEGATIDEVDCNDDDGLRFRNSFTTESISSALQVC